MSHFVSTLQTGIYSDVPVFNDWIDQTMANTSLTEYEYLLQNTSTSPTFTTSTMAPSSNNSAEKHILSQFCVFIVFFSFIAVFFLFLT